MRRVKGFRRWRDITWLAATLAGARRNRPLYHEGPMETTMLERPSACDSRSTRGTARTEC
jgi:hypothetical protein